MDALWNFADIWGRYAELVPDAPAQSHRGATQSWAQFDQRANAVAATILAAGAAHQDKVALYLYNSPEYLEATFAAFKASLVPVNTNYRYTTDELVHLWDNADTFAVVFHGSFAESCAEVRSQVPSVRCWLWVDDDSGPCPEWAIAYEPAAAAAVAPIDPPWARSEDDLLLMYTGGTTGLPKGVMWRQADLIGSFESANRIRLGRPAEPTLAARAAKGGPRSCPVAPLMHGTGMFGAMTNLDLAGCIVTLAGRRFDPVELLDTIAAERINSLSIVGDAFAKPILAALDAEPDRWDVSSLRVIVSSGVMWSPETKSGLLAHNPRLLMVDTLGSSEAIGMATNTASADAAPRAARFALGPNARVLTEDGRDVVAGSGERGRVALAGFVPVGYYKDPEKSAATFPVYDGVRYSVPGDWAEVAEDGTVVLLGRGSQCINTGGEKVYPEEVEEALKTHPTVHDAAVVGLPDERFGEAITALVELSPGAELEPDDARRSPARPPRCIQVAEALGRRRQRRPGRQRQARLSGAEADRDRLARPLTARRLTTLAGR